MLRPSIRYLVLAACAFCAPAALAQSSVDPLASAGIPEVTAAERAVPGAPRTFANPLEPEAAPAYYVVRRDEPVRDEPEQRGAVTDRLRLRTPVHLLASEGDWSLVSYGRERGYVLTAALDNVWLRFDKSERAVYVYRGPVLLRVLPADAAMSDEDKTFRSRRGVHEEYRTPEGTYFVGRRNASSQYHLAFVLNYPNSHDALEGAREGLISDAEYDAIVRAEEQGVMPPQGTRLGGLIEIHGNGSGRQRAWTRGCVALRNVHMDWLWGIVQVGTPVVVER